MVATPSSGAKRPLCRQAWRGGVRQVRQLSLSDHGDTTWPGNSQDKRRNYLTRRDIQTFCAAFQTLHVGDQRCHYKKKKGAFTGHSQAMISWVRMGTRPLVPLNGSDAPRGDEWPGRGGQVAAAPVPPQGGRCPGPARGKLKGGQLPHRGDGSEFLFGGRG